MDKVAYSSRSQAWHNSPEEEMQGRRAGLEILNRNHPDGIIAVDPSRAEVARGGVEE